MIETLGYTMQEVIVIADTSLEIQDVNRKLKELIEEIVHYYGDDSTVPKDIFDLVQGINEEIKDLEYKCNEY